MAKIVGVYNTAHTPFCYQSPDGWNAVRAQRRHRADVPMDDLDSNRKKYERIQNAFATLRSKIAAAEPDVIVIFGDDQLECFDFRNFPSFAVYVGESFEGDLASAEALARDFAVNPGGDIEGNGGPKRALLKGHPELGVSILSGVMKRGFDPAFCMDMPKPEHGLGHAFLRPAETLTDFQTPLIPVLFNSYYAPQPTAMRCYEFGKAVRDAIYEHPADLRVAVIGSGGLWHTPGADQAYLDEDFDRTMLGHLEAGDAKAMAQHFDSYRIPEGDVSQYVGERGPQITGMPGFGGPQGGTRETTHWIASAGVTEGHRATIIDYVPVYASPIGVGFSYCEDL
jgi:hypothetical protein